MALPLQVLYPNGGEKDLSEDAMTTGDGGWWREVDGEAPGGWVLGCVPYWAGDRRQRPLGTIMALCVVTRETWTPRLQVCSPASPPCACGLECVFCIWNIPGDQ